MSTYQTHDQEHNLPTSERFGMVVLEAKGH